MDSTKSQDHTNDGRITKQMLKTRSGEFDVESIHSLSFRNYGLHDLGCIGECVGLERLDLSRNDLTQLYGLAALTNLTTLNLSANRITSLEGLQALDNLEKINLSGNLIGSVDALRPLSGLENLINIRLQDKIQGLENPVCMNTSYKVDITTLLPRITRLDGEVLTGRGSDLYRKFAEMDQALKEMPNYFDPVDRPPPQPWVSVDFWEATPEPSEYQHQNLEESMDQLHLLIGQCHKLKDDAETKINHFLEELNSQKSDNSSGKSTS